MRKQRQQKIIIKGNIDLRKQQQIINLIKDTFQIKVVWKASKNQDDKQSPIRNVIPCLMKKFYSYIESKNIYSKEQLQDLKQSYNLGHLKTIFNNNNYKDIQNYWITYLEEESGKNITDDKKIIQKSNYILGRDLLLQLSLQSQQWNNADPLKNFLTIQKNQQTQNQSQENNDNTLDQQYDSTG